MKSGGGGDSQMLQWLMFAKMNEQFQQQQAEISRQQELATQKQSITVQNNVANDTWNMLRQFGARTAMGVAGSMAPAISPVASGGSRPAGVAR